MKYRQNLCLSILILLIVLVSCSPHNLWFINDEEFNAPCWKGICPNYTSMPEAKSKIYSIEDIPLESIKEEDLSKNNYLHDFYDEGIFWKYSEENEYNGYITFNENLVSDISFNFDKPIPLSKFIEIYGEPNNIYIAAIQGDTFIYINLYIIYDQKNVCLSHSFHLFSTRIPKLYEIRKSTEISTMVLYENTIADGIISSGCFTGMNEIEYLENIQSWNGYTDYYVNN